MSVDTLVVLAQIFYKGRTRDLYTHYWLILAEHYGERELAELTITDLQLVLNRVQENARKRASSVDGRSAVEHAVSAWRALYVVAIDNDAATQNVALRLRKPKRLAVKRTSLTPSQLADLFAVVTDDQTLVLRFLFETGCRREGLLSLTPASVHASRQTIKLREKYEKAREVPVTTELMEALLDPECLLYGWTRRRMDGLVVRVQRTLPWASEVRWTPHWCRHHAIQTYESHGGYAVAAAFAGHELKGATGTYLEVGIGQVCQTFSRIYGVSHPLA